MDIFYHLVIITGIYIILSTCLNLLLGYTGMFSIAHGAFYAIGAYTSAILVVNYNIPFFLELVIVAIISGFFGILIALPTLKLKGDFLCLGTLAFASFTHSVLNNWYSLTNGPLGIHNIPPITLFNFSFVKPRDYACLTLFFTIISVLIIKRIVSSSFGRVLTSIREDYIVTLSLGKNVSRFKIIAFFISTFFAGIAGILFTHYFRFIDPSSFTVTESFLILSMVIFGGRGTIAGSISGAVIMVCVPEVIRFIGIPSFYAAHIRQIIFGGLITLVILKKPEGFLGRKQS